jgi:hypothetical protein
MMMSNETKCGISKQYVPLLKSAIMSEEKKIFPFSITIEMVCRHFSKYKIIIFGH